MGVYCLWRMDSSHSISIRSQARALLEACWKARGQIWRNQDITIQQFLLQAPAQIATNLLRLRLTVVREISNPDALTSGRNSGEVLGVLERDRKRIIVAQRFGYEQSRFTLAHEIGHYRLHPGLIQHRELLLPSARRTREERDADLFAAELLMPSKLLREQFLARFRGIVDGTRSDCATYYWLSRNGVKISKGGFLADRTYRAEQIARSCSCFGRDMISLCEFFGVSQKAIAIQLIDLGLVK
jgi:Zn-dependent peptidase ImmA (M78 family)